MAGGLIRAADHLEERAERLDDTVMGWRKNAEPLGEVGRSGPVAENL
jgi:hypothetical protein